MATITKVALMTHIKNSIALVKPQDLNLSDEFEIQFQEGGTNWCVIKIKDPREGAPRYYEIRVTEKVS